jgi:WD40 repeat protein
MLAAANIGKKEDVKAAEEPVEEVDDEKDEKIGHEFFDFVHYPTDNSGEFLKSKSTVLILCSLQPNGYVVEQKIYAGSDGNDSRGDFKFSNNLSFSGCGKYFVTWNAENEFVVYDAKKLTVVHEYELDKQEGDYGGSILLSHGAKYLFSHNIFSESFIFTYDASTGAQVSENTTDYGLNISKFVGKDELVGFHSESGNVIKINARDLNSIDYSENTKTSYGIKFNNNGYACVYESEGMLYYQDIRGGNDAMKLMEGYDKIRNYNIDGNNVSVIYTDDSKNYISLYHKNILVFRKRHETSAYSTFEAIISNEHDQVIMVEFEGSSKVRFMLII